jgi:GGDEF domain-containing protein
LVRALRLLVFPSGLVFILALFLALRLQPEILSTAWIKFFPVPVFLSVLWLAWRFQRSRFAQLGIFLVASWLICSWHVLFSLKGLEGAQDAFAVFLPLVFGFICWLRDRSCTSRRGLVGFLWVGLPLLTLLVPARENSLAVGFTWLDQRLLSVPYLGEILGTHDLFSSIRPVVACSALLALLSLSLCFYRRRSQVETGFFWALLLSLLALVGEKAGWVVGCSYLFYTAAGIVLFVAMVEQFQSLAYRDELTGLLSRRALQEKLSGLGRRYAIAMVDIDHFKRFNDRYGHDTGDELLRMVAARLQKTGGGCTAYRFGGEEFTLVFSGLNAEDAAPFLEEVRAAIKESRFTPRHWSRPLKKPTKGKAKRKRSTKSLGVTVSIGCSDSSRPRVVPDDVLKSADQALYRAKRGGRNRVVLKPPA